jgi:hypothetical protein
VQCNDELYGGAPNYMAELSETINLCVSELLKLLTALGDKPEASAKLNQARAALDLVNQIAASMDMTGGVAAFALKLLELAAKQKALFVRQDQRYFANTVEFTLLVVSRSNAAAAKRGTNGSGSNNISSSNSGTEASDALTASFKALLV